MKPSPNALACLLLLFVISCETTTKSVDSCGDSFLDPGEQCDRSNIPVGNCQELGFYQQNGELSCNDDCTLDLSACSTFCGDGTIQTQHGEECEGANVGGKTCQTFGLGAGELGCTEDCLYDVSGCEVQASCGDSVITSPFEHCEGTDLGGETCESLGYYNGVLSCDLSCHFDLGSCESFGRCGDTVIQVAYDEQCEGTDLQGQTCESLGYHGGLLRCGSDCHYDVTPCAAIGRCGDDTLQADHGETCDGADLGAQTCEALGFYGGTLACNPDCTLDSSDCGEAGRCGDGVLQTVHGELCDGAELDGNTCQSLGYYGGALACDIDCHTFDEAGCAAIGRCGDGTLQSDHGEMCDGADLGTITCDSLGYYGGALACNTDCTLDSSGCGTGGRCGDGVLQAGYGETCDGAALAGQTCVTLGYYGGTLACAADCQAFNESGCAAVGRCGDGLLQAGEGETCDGAAMAGQTCVTRGYYGGILSCAGDCHAFDESGCAAVGRCGDSVTQASFGEECDLADFDGASCTSMGYYGGALACTSECLFDEAGCAAVGRCGDNALQAAYGEVCDGAALAGQSCLTAGYYGGTLACSSDCHAFDESDCAAAGRCGDSVAQSAHEDCDHDDLLGDSCRTQGFFTGDLQCTASCTLDPADCMNSTQVVTGKNHACAILQDGTVRCWGRNEYGQLGDGTTTDSFFPVTVPVIGQVAYLTAGDYHTCAVHDEGPVWCWGRNEYGQLGDGSTTDRLSPVTVAGLTVPVRIAAGAEFTCASQDGGTARCWGRNQYGQLGNNSITDSATSVAVSSLTGVTHLAAGGQHACARLSDGTVKCWGRNNNGQLGDGTISTRLVPVVVSGLTSVSDLDLGLYHSCARISTGTAKCWGRNGEGQLGDGTTTQRTSPVLVSGLVGVSDLTAGDFHGCVTLSSGAARCWGFNSYGQLGDGTITQRTSPVLVTGLTNASRISAGGYFTCAWLSGGLIACWGHNLYGQLGDGSTRLSTFPVPVVEATGVEHLLAGGYHNCYFSDDGPVWCWGNNGGALGNGSTESSTSPVSVSGLSGVLEVATGGTHTCAVISTGEALCWGQNSYGQLGDGSTTARTTPVTVVGLGLSGVAHLATGNQHTCALLNSGETRCWGRNTRGALGDGTTTDAHVPVTVSGLTGVDRLSAWTWHTCARLSDGTARCWGNNGSGQLGNGSTTDSSTPVTVVGLSDATDIRVGMYHTCALRSDGTAACWGANANGQLGDGTNLDKTVPVPVSGLTAVAHLDTGSEHTCAVKTDGSVVCWGKNDAGQLGDGSLTNALSPVTVPGLEPAGLVEAGHSHSCALLQDGTVSCWGGNTALQLGLYYYSVYSVPNLVVP